MSHDQPAPASSRRETLHGYGGRHHIRAAVARPRSRGELRETLLRAAREGRRVTIRGGGQSIDDRALGGDLVISTARLDSIEVDAAAACVTVGPGATWGAILRRLPRGLVPHVVVTTSAATAGGTLSADCISRFSPCSGRESRHVTRFELMTVDGRTLVCAREGEHADAFAAVTAGLGYVGVIVSVTYALLDLRALLVVAPPGAELRVETDVRVRAGFDAIVDDVLTARPATGEPEAVYAVATLDERGAVHRSRYVARGGPLRPLPIARPPDLPRLVLECLMWPAPVGRAMWRIILGGYYRLRTSFLDDLASFTFCMDANARAVALVRGLGGEVYLVQQTFVIPAAPAARAASVTRVAGFMRAAARRLTEGGLSPTLFDVLYLPPDAGRDPGGVAVTVAFVTTERARVDALAAILIELSAACRSAGGHVHLVKDVHARPADLAAMHARRLDQLFAVRTRLDPRGVMRNDFFDRVLAAARVDAA